MITADARMQIDTPSSLMAKIEAVFSAIQRERMADMPLLNPALRVEAVAFAPWREAWAGVLITPWFMNLMLLPQTGQAWHALASGQTVIHAFPSGAYAFVAGFEPALGDYQSCSLFSPMFEFPDQAQARATAVAAMAHLRAAQTADKPALQAPSSVMSRRTFLRGGLARSNSRDA